MISSYHTPCTVLYLIIQHLPFSVVGDKKTTICNRQFNTISYHSTNTNSDTAIYELVRRSGTSPRPAMPNGMDQIRTNYLNTCSGAYIQGRTRAHPSYREHSKAPRAKPRTLSATSTPCFVPQCGRDSICCRHRSYRSASAPGAGPWSGSYFVHSATFQGCAEMQAELAGGWGGGARKRCPAQSSGFWICHTDESCNRFFTRTSAMYSSMIVVVCWAAVYQV